MQQSYTLGLQGIAVSPNPVVLNPNPLSGRAAGAVVVSQAALERAGEDEELRFGSERWQKVLQFGDECYGVFAQVFHMCADVTGGTSGGINGNESAAACCMLKMCAVC
jgi:hypothetical protein